MIGVPPYSPGDYLDVRGRSRQRHDPPRRLLPAPAAAHPRRRSRAARRGPGAARGAGLRSRRTARDRARRSWRTRSSSRVSSSTSASPSSLAAIRAAVGAPRAGRDRVLVGRTRRADDPPHRSRGRVLRDRRVVRRRVLPPRARRAHVPRRPHPRPSRRPGRRFEPGATGFETGDVYTPRSDDPRVTLELAPAAAWVAEAYPTEAVTERRRRLARDRARGQRAGLARAAAAAARSGRPGRRPGRGRGARGRRRPADPGRYRGLDADEYRRGKFRSGSSDDPEARRPDTRARGRA